MVKVNVMLNLIMCNNQKYKSRDYTERNRYFILSTQGDWYTELTKETNKGEDKTDVCPKESKGEDLPNFSDCFCLLAFDFEVFWFCFGGGGDNK